MLCYVACSAFGALWKCYMERLLCIVLLIAQALGKTVGKTSVMT